jgi:tetrahydromethanopterin S-methyltransferase subunit G
VTFGTVGDGRGTDLSLALPFPIDFFFKPMPTTLPASVRDTLGEEAAVDFARWLDETLQQRTVKRDEYREVLSRLDVLEERFDYVEERFDLMEKRMDERFEQIDQRFEQIDRRFESMEEQFNERFESMEERFDSRLAGMKEEFNGCFETMDAKLDRMNDRILSMTRWLIGLIALFGSLVTALLAVAQFGG